jgi:ADP-ribose pyrophosphatase YjhB (NUDIX family)
MSPMGAYMAWLRSRVGTATILVPSVNAVVRDDEGRILLQRHAEGGDWGLPGGAVEPEEDPADALVREVWEETALEVELGRVLGAYGGPDATIHYDNGDVTSHVRIAYAATVSGGTLRPDGVEVLEARFMTAEERAQVPLPRIVAQMLADAERG